ncbi:MAG: hypothetical protein JJU36_14435 [Phycisphaeraceae bacterium]|nr:hypothetical protein [Phycisphaeraceae bacterium]
MTDSLMRTSLLDLFHTLGVDARGILLGGGYGLYLKQLHLEKKRVSTLIGAHLWPSPRATEDLDLMLSPELVANAHSMAALRDALDNLKYQVVDGSEYLQFKRSVSPTHTVKIDLLTAQLDVLKVTPGIRADSRRARPAATNRPQLHAHPADGALMLTDRPLMIELTGTLSTGKTYAAQVAIPHPFSYLLMKLTAYRDRRHDADKDLGRHHALDVFRIVAMLTETEFEHSLANLRHHKADAQVQSCAALVSSDFSGSTKPGILAMRSHPLWRNDQQLEVFLETLTRMIS